jgi:hypothetical protein
LETGLKTFAGEVNFSNMLTQPEDEKRIIFVVKPRKDGKGYTVRQMN